MTTQEVFEKLEKKQTLSQNRNAIITVQRVCVNEEMLRTECKIRNIPVRVELGMLVIG